MQCSADSALIGVLKIATIWTDFIVDACPDPFAAIVFLSRKFSAFIGGFATLSVFLQPRRADRFH